MIKYCEKCKTTVTPVKIVDNEIKTEWTCPVCEITYRRLRGKK